MSNVSALDRETWNKFFNRIDYYLSAPSDPNDQCNGFEESAPCYSAAASSTDDTERLTEVKARRGQDRFRSAVLASYNYSCAITGISDTRLLVASHIAPWATNVGRRLDPRNGICLSALLDKAFDTGVISFSNDFNILFSPTATNDTISILSKTGLTFSKPTRFLPDQRLLEEHRYRFGFSEIGK
ncbi:MAG: HNH endonuclease [Rubellimicrobium sp.]|nr:HNH endonuclease [Rubellimicrobium sp.]